MPHQEITRDEVAKHNTEDSLWCIIDHKVYDLTDFVDAHPGGSVVLAQVAGTDATAAFYNLHRHEVLQKYDSQLCVGVLAGEKPEVVDPQPGDLSQVPYAEPLWLRPQFHSPYYAESHRRLQRAVRLFTDTHVTPEAQEKERDGSYISQALIDKMAEANLLAMKLGPGPHLHGRQLLGGAVDGKEFDYFHDLVVAQESVRPKARGFQDGNMAGMMISLTAVRQWLGDKALQAKVTEECLSGKKKICLAITEAFAGSDVAGIRTTATKTPDGKHYIINGTKKWITNGMFSDYFVVGCKTDKGFSVILVERGEGVETKPIKTSYSTAAATAFIQFENVKVPVNHLLGKEHKGFTVIMSNFNHERWAMCCGVIGWQRIIVEECLKWSNQRIVFGKNLLAQPVIRQKCVSLALDAVEFRLTEEWQAGQDDLARRGQPGVAGADHAPDVQDDLRAAGQAPERAHRAAEVVRNALGARSCGRGGQHLWRAWHHPVGHGKGGGALPPVLQVRRDPGWHRGDSGRSRGETGDEGDAKGHVVDGRMLAVAMEHRRLLVVSRSDWIDLQRIRCAGLAGMSPSSMG